MDKEGDKEMNQQPDNKAERIGNAILEVCDPLVFSVKSITRHPTKKLEFLLCCTIIGTIKEQKSK